MISLLAVQAICNSKNPAIELIYPFLCDTITANQIDTPLRTAMFIAQGAFESTAFHQLEELASGAEYEGRTDLGNTEPGDGKLFKGRGVFMITGRFNYAKVSVALFGFDSILLNNPERLTEPELAAKSAGWFWNTRGLNVQADNSDVVGATKKINGGTYGLTAPLNWNRMWLYSRARQALGI